MGKVPTEMELILEQTQQGISHEVSIHALAGNHVKEILLKLNLPDHRTLKDGGEVLKLKNFKKDASKSSQVIKSRKLKKAVATAELPESAATYTELLMWL
nr:hypothetical protein [Tanacetum cinerariifolium]